MFYFEQVIIILLLNFYLYSTSSYKVTYDQRSFMIDNERILFISGSFHYPRAPRSEWATIFQLIKDNGVNIIQTYVFWDIHEPFEHQFNYYEHDSISSYNLIAFIQEAWKHKLYVNLRIAGYICAEWNYGGFPVWLRDLNITYRTYDELWLEKLSIFIEKTIDIVKKYQLLASQDGPVVMLQIENEYGNMEKYYGENGRKYVEWLSNYALSFNDLGVPWIMCQQGEGIGTAPSSEDIINTCNGFYCDDWIVQHQISAPNQPHMFTENWPGWFQKYGEGVPHRPAVDVAYSVAKWYAKGGSYMNYYMLYGGTTFDRYVGGPRIITSYDYDVMINEYSLKSEPKYTLLQNLHNILAMYSDLLLSLTPLASSIIEYLPYKYHTNQANKNASSTSCESYIYRNESDLNQCIAFLINSDETSSCDFVLFSNTKAIEVSLPFWSVTIAVGYNCSKVIYNTKLMVFDIATNNKVMTPLADIQFSSYIIIPEPIPTSLTSTIDQSLLYMNNNNNNNNIVDNSNNHNSDNTVYSNIEEIKSRVIHSLYPSEQLSLTKDHTDYMWYTTIVPTISPLSTTSTSHPSTSTSTKSTKNNVELHFLSGIGGENVYYIYANQHLVATTLTSNTITQEQSTRNLMKDPKNDRTARYERTEKIIPEIEKNENRIDNIDYMKISITFEMPINNNGDISSFNLSILSVSMGLKNYGPYLEEINTGIISNITLNNHILTNFTHIIGLQNEFLLKYHSTDLSFLQLDNNNHKECNSLCWFITSFPTPKSLHIQDSLVPFYSLAIEISKYMGKGIISVNGHVLGRYWNLTATTSTPTSSLSPNTIDNTIDNHCNGCEEFEYSGSYNGNRCRTGCGEPSQNYYKLPSEWLYSHESGQANKMVILDEVNQSNPKNIQIVSVSMSS